MFKALAASTRREIVAALVAQREIGEWLDTLWASRLTRLQSIV